MNRKNKQKGLSQQHNISLQDKSVAQYHQSEDVTNTCSSSTFIESDSSQINTTFEDEYSQKQLVHEDDEITVTNPVSEFQTQYFSTHDEGLQSSFCKSDETSSTNIIETKVLSQVEINESNFSDDGAAYHLLSEDGSVKTLVEGDLAVPGVSALTQNCLIVVENSDGSQILTRLVTGEDGSNPQLIPQSFFVDPNLLTSGIQSNQTIVIPTECSDGEFNLSLTETNPNIATFDHTNFTVIGNKTIISERVTTIEKTEALSKEKKNDKSVIGVIQQPVRTKFDDEEEIRQKEEKRMKEIRDEEHRLMKSHLQHHSQQSRQKIDKQNVEPATEEEPPSEKLPEEHVLDDFDKLPEHILDDIPIFKEITAELNCDVYKKVPGCSRFLLHLAKENPKSVKYSNTKWSFKGDIEALVELFNSLKRFVNFKSKSFLRFYTSTKEESPAPSLKASQVPKNDKAIDCSLLVPYISSKGRQLKQPSKFTSSGYVQLTDLCDDGQENDDFQTFSKRRKRPLSNSIKRQNKRRRKTKTSRNRKLCHKFSKVDTQEHLKYDIAENEIVLTKDDVADNVLTNDNFSETVLAKDDIADNVLTNDNISETVVAKDDITDTVVNKVDTFKTVLTNDNITETVLNKDGIAESVLIKDSFNETTFSTENAECISIKDDIDQSQAVIDKNTPCLDETKTTKSNHDEKILTSNDLITNDPLPETIIVREVSVKNDASLGAKQTDVVGNSGDSELKACLLTEEKSKRRGRPPKKYDSFVKYEKVKPRNPLTESASTRHQRNNEEKIPFKYFCNKCSFKTKRQSHLLIHSQCHKDGIEKKYHCEQCDFVTISPIMLKRHELKHKKAVYRCKICTKYTTDKPSLLNKHMKLKHSESCEEMLQCTQCQFQCSSTEGMAKHVSSTHNKHDNSDLETININDTPTCNICQKTFKNAMHLKRHYRDVHGPEVRPHLCDTCGKAFKRTDALQQHRIVHLERSARTLPFKCATCNKGFRSAAHLKEHMSMHTTERPYLCQYCGAAFKTQPVQKKHILTLHIKPKTHVCTVCCLQFNTKNALQKHEASHNISDTTTHILQYNPIGTSEAVLATIELQKEMKEEGLVPGALDVTEGFADAGPSDQDVEADSGTLVVQNLINSVDTDPAEQPTIESVTETGIVAGEEDEDNISQAHLNLFKAVQYTFLN